MARSVSSATKISRHALSLANVSQSSKAVLRTSSGAQLGQAAFYDGLTTPDQVFLENVQKLYNPVIDFNDPETVFASKPTSALLRSFAILKACRLKPLVHNAETLLGLSKAAIGTHATAKFVESTFFKQFCAGTNAQTIQPTLSALREAGLQPILNYAAEDDVDEPITGEDGGNLSLAAEAGLDRQARTFLRSIADCDASGPARGFVGIKLTGLTQPDLLERMSSILTEIGGSLDRGHSSRELRSAMAPRLEPTELQAFDNLMSRVHSLAAAAHAKGNVRMLVDAEQTYMQPAIDAVTLALQMTYNKEGAVVMNTYQCYLKDSAHRISNDLRRAGDEGWIWGAKTVRGAYMRLERARASETGFESPIQDSAADTHANYDSCVEHVMRHVAKGSAELMVASHNQTSIEAALDGMRHLAISPRSPTSGLYFGQLLGMADHLSFPLGAAGYNAYKICAYGSVNETTAFLLRRALENSDMLGGCARELDLIRAEIWRRTTGFGGRSSASSPPQTALGHA